MKNLLKLLNIALLMIGLHAGAQSFDWVESFPNPYNLNPGYTTSPISIGANGELVHARLDTFRLSYSQSLYGDFLVEERDASGVINRSLRIGPKANVLFVKNAPGGDVYIAGEYFDWLYIGSNDSLANTGTGFSNNFFLMKTDASGTIQWIRNLSLDHAQSRMDAACIDLSGNFWYTMTNFGDGDLYQIDSNGMDTDSIHIEGALLISSLDFDPQGNIIVAGANSSGNFIIGDSIYNPTESYMMFLTKIGMDGQPHWANFIRDITFQFPAAASDNNGNIFFAGPLFDSTRFGQILLDRPKWVSDFFLAKADPDGNFLWVKQSPPSVTGITGRFQIDSKDCISTDAFGRVYLGGSTYGFLNWPGGITWGSGSVTDRALLWACFDGNGNQVWNTTGGCNSFNVMHAVEADDSGNCYFSVATRDSANYGAFLFTAATPIQFARGKINGSGPVSIPEFTALESAVFPNPSTGLLKFMEIDPNTHLTVMDLSGKILKQTLIYSGSALDATDLEPGLYILRLYTENPSADRMIRWIRIRD